MSQNRFEEILGSIAYTSNNPPELLDKFWEVRQLIGEWNEKIKKIHPKLDQCNQQVNVEVAQ